MQTFKGKDEITKACQMSKFTEKKNETRSLKALSLFMTKATRIASLDTDISLNIQGNF